MDIVHTRLLNQHLIGDKFDSPEEVVAHLGAVQSQDFPAAKWGLGIRIKNASDEQIQKAFDEGKILRTHVMRPTWHFVLPEDIVWMQELTSSRVKRLMSSYNKKLELTDELFAKSQKVIEKSLRNHIYLTRQELKKILLDKLKIQTDVQRLAHIVSWAELDAIICSGPKIGKQLTYALVDERVPKTKKINREEALAKLTLKYFTSHGPAQVKDFSWWSGLSVKDSLLGLDLIKSKLEQITIEGKTYWFSHHKPSTINHRPLAHLLSIFDEYVIAYNDRSDLSEKNDIARMLAMGNALTAVIALDGRVVGTWKRELKKEKVIIKPNLFRKLKKEEQKALEKASQEYAKFLGLNMEIL